MNKFKWGVQFFTLNAEILDEYAKCTDAASVIAAQNRYIERIEAEATANRQRPVDLPPTGSSSDED